MRVTSAVRLPGIRLYQGQDDDLIAWCFTLEELPFGAKGQRIKEMLRQGLVREQVRQNAIPASEVDMEKYLGLLRDVVEAAVTNALSRSTLSPRIDAGNPPSIDVGTAANVEELLDMFGDSLFLAESDDASR